MNRINWSEEKLNEMLTTPSQGFIDDVAKIEGDIMILGAGGKMGPDMCILAARAVKQAGIEKKVYAVSRFSDKAAAKRLEDEGVTVISADLMTDGALENLPDCKNIIFMAGRKFGTNGSEYLTWGTLMNPPDVLTLLKKLTITPANSIFWFILTLMGLTVLFPAIRWAVRLKWPALVAAVLAVTAVYIPRLGARYETMVYWLPVYLAGA